MTSVDREANVFEGASGITVVNNSPDDVKPNVVSVDRISDLPPIVVDAVSVGFDETKAKVGPVSVDSEGSSVVKIVSPVIALPAVVSAGRTVVRPVT